MLQLHVTFVLISILLTLEPVARHRPSVTSRPPKLLSPGSYLLTILKGRMNSWLDCTMTAQAEIQTQSWKFVVRDTNHYTVATALEAPLKIHI